jgi:hypothetical protein
MPSIEVDARNGQAGVGVYNLVVGIERDTLLALRHVRAHKLSLDPYSTSEGYPIRLRG